MRETSQLLKNQREAMDISLVEVSIATKITPRTLQAMEAADLDHLPARSFLRGFVKSYAAFLKMDVDDVLKTFQDEMTALEGPPVISANPTVPPAPAASEVVTPSPEIIVPRAPEPIRKTAGPLVDPDSGRTKKVGTIVGLIALVAVVSMVYRTVMKYEREGQVEAPPAPITPVNAAPDAATTTEKSTEAEAKPEVKAEEVKAAETKSVERPAEVKAAEVKPVETKPTEAKPAEVKPPEKKEVAALTPPTPPVKVEEKKTEDKKADSTTEAPPRKLVQEIIIEALDKVEVSFKVGNGDSQKVTLMPDQVHTIKAAGPIGIELSDGGAVNVVVNGRDVGVPGDLGKPKKIQFP